MSKSPATVVLSRHHALAMRSALAAPKMVISGRDGELLEVCLLCNDEDGAHQRGCKRNALVKALTVALGLAP